MKINVVSIKGDEEKRRVEEKTGEIEEELRGFHKTLNTYVRL